MLIVWGLNMRICLIPLPEKRKRKKKSKFSLPSLVRSFFSFRFRFQISHLQFASQENSNPEARCQRGLHIHTPAKTPHQTALILISSSIIASTAALMSSSQVQFLLYFHEIMFSICLIAEITAIFG